MPTKQIIAVFTLLFALSLQNANAFMSYGVRGCGKFVSAVDATGEKDKYNKDLTEMVVKSWIAGYATSYNSWLDAITKKDNSDVFGKTDIDGVYMSILNYCRAYPLNNISEAMTDTINQLDPQQPKRKH
jgi:hypothetical protein